MRRGLFSALLCVPLLATGAAAQTVVPDDWPLKPSGLGEGDQFRLMFITSARRNATSTDIGVYNTFVQARAAAGHMSIQSHSSQFRALGSTTSVHARDNTMTTGTGVPIYWLGGAKVADDYADFYDGSWDSKAGRNQAGVTVATSETYWTGSNNNGTRAGNSALGGSSFVIRSGLNISSTLRFSAAQATNNRSLLAMSPVFEVRGGASLSVSDGTVAESASPPLMRFTVRLSEPVARTVQVRARTRESSPPSASYRRDFTPFRQGLVFRPGQTEKHIWVRVIPDSRAEGPETFEVELLRAQGAWVADAIGVGTITDAATPAAVTVSRASVTVTEGGDAAHYSVAVSTPPGSGETVTVTATPDDAAVQVNGGASAALRFTARNWTMPQTVTVTARNDADMDDESVGIAHTVSGPAAWTGVTAPAVAVAVADDDAPAGPPAAGFARAASAVAEDAGTGTVRVTLSSPAAAPLPLAYTVTGTATAGTDYTAPAGTVTVPAGATGADIAVAVTDDTMDEPDETVVLTLAAGAGYTVGDAGEHTLTVTDDDAPPPGAPAVSIAPAPGGTAAEGGNAVFTLTAERAPSADLAVTVEVSDAPESDFVAEGDEGERTVTILAGQAAADFSVAITPDSDDEPGGSVTAAVAAGHGYPVGAPSSASVAVADDDPTGVTLSSSTDAIPEDGGTKVLEVTLERALVEGERLNVPVVLQSPARRWKDYNISCWTDHGVGCRYVGAPGGQVYFIGGPDATRTARLTITTIDDSEDEGTGETLTVSLGAPSGNLGGGASVSGPVSFLITDDDDPLPVATIAGGAAVTEGGSAEFTVSVSPAPAADLLVWVEVSDAWASDFLARGADGRRRVTVLSGQGSATLTLATQQDDLDEPDGTVRAALAAGAGYRLGAASSASVTVTDDDASARPTLSIDDAAVTEGGRMQFNIRLSAPQPHTVRFAATPRDSTPVSARGGQDYLPARLLGEILPGRTVANVWVRTLDDSHNEDPETFEVVLSNARGAAIGDGMAVGTITNDDPMPAAWLARFGRTVAEQALDGIAGRMAAPREAGMQGSVAGQALSSGPGGSPGSRGAGFGAGHAPGGAAGGTGALALAGVAPAFGSHPGHPGAAGAGQGMAGFGSGFDGMQPQPGSMTGRDVLLGSGFSLTGAADGSGGSLAFWGRAAQGRFDGSEGTFSLDGEVTTGMFGADYARGKWLVGLALAQSAGKGDYRDTDTAPRPGDQGCPQGAGPLCGDAVREGDGSVEASLAAAIPYAALQASERLKLWGAAGHGTGEVTLKTATGGRYKADTGWSMAAAGLRGDLLAPPGPGPGAGSGSGLALAVTSDALWTRTSSEKTRDLAASDSDATRLRLGLEGSYRVALGGGGHVTPKLEAGARHDGGDAETGFGVELGGGLKWAYPALGLSLDISGRTLIAHEDDELKDRGFSASLGFDPAPATGRGLSLGLRQDWGGRAQGGLDALFQPATLDGHYGSEEAASRWAMEATYGLPAFGGRWTGSPHVGLGLAAGARDYSVGWRLAPESANAPDLSLGLRATRRESDTAEPVEHAVGLEITARW